MDASAVHECHVYKDVLKPSIGEKHAVKHTMQVMKGNKTVRHLPREFSRIVWYFLAHGAEISDEVISRRKCSIFIY